MTQTLENRFKILFLLTSKLGVMEKQMDELAQQLDAGNPKCEEAMTYYENEILRILEL